MTKVTFETPTLADSLRKANAVAPTRGGNHSGMAGIIMKVVPDSENPVTIMATDGDIFYMETVGAIAITGEPATWRMPSNALTAIITNLPMGNAHQVTLDDSLEEGRVMIKSGRAKVKLASLDVSDYPLWEPFQTGEIITIPNFGKIIQRLKWACGERSGTLRSVFITSDSLFSTDRFKAARVTMLTSLTGHVVVPNEQLVKVLPRDGDVKISQSNHIFVASPDDFTQVATTTYEESLLPIGRILDAEYQYETNFSRQAMLASLNRALAFDSGNRQSLIKLIIGKGEIGIVTNDQEVGIFGEQIDAHGAAESDKRRRLQVGPNTLRDILMSLESDNVKMFYNDHDEAPKVLTFRDGSYACTIALSKRDEKKDDDGSNQN